MRKKEKNFSFRDQVALVEVVGIVIFGVYQLGKLGYDWTVEGVHAYKKSKKFKNEK